MQVDQVKAKIQVNPAKQNHAPDTEHDSLHIGDADKATANFEEAPSPGDSLNAGRKGSKLSQ